ncbi:MAG TPA: TldD/PmbA family protein [Synergistales bacterium]|nr:TldD/PmbA family protein [Synergistales bacterium]
MQYHEIIHQALGKVLDKKPDYADLFFESSVSHDIHFEDGTMEEISSSVSEGTGARAMCGDMSAFVHAPTIEAGGAIRCLFEAARNLGCDVTDLYGDYIYTPYRIIETRPDLSPPRMDFMHNIDKDLRKRTGLIKQVSMRHSHSRRKIAIFRPDGRTASDVRDYSTFIVQVVVERNGLIQTGLESRAFSISSALFWNQVDPLDVARKALSRAMTMIDANECPAGTMPVVLEGQAGGTMIHEACGHGLEADIIQKDYSVYREKIGQIVASPVVTLVDDGNLPGYYGSYGCDDEGTPPERTILIEQGVLKSFMTDYMTSRKGDLPLTGNGRRSSYRSMPIPRMSNTFILPGTTEPSDIIRKVEKGLLVRKMGGGEVNPTSGDFVFQVTEGYKIENGQIIHPVRGAMLIGNGPEVLKDIIEIGNDLHFMPGVCGKAGQSVPVTDGQPTMLIRQMVVGGKEV